MMRIAYGVDLRLFYCVEHEDMTLCVDCSTHWFDVEQAHLSFCRQSDSSNLSMPSLRSLVRPTVARMKLPKPLNGLEKPLHMSIFILERPRVL